MKKILLAAIAACAVAAAHAVEKDTSEKMPW